MSPTPPPLSPPRPRPAQAPKALEGIRVADFSHFIAGPFCSLMLADFGADVIKIENKDGGDAFRVYPPRVGGEAVPYLWVNRGKRSVAVDLKSKAGREIALDIIATSDVVLENFSTGVMDRFGLSYETLRERKPDLIYCAVTAYGRTGKFAHRFGFDPVTQAESGFMSMNGYPDQEPVRTSPSMIDISTALMACNAVQAALLAKARTGQGQYVEVNMITTAVNMLGNFSLAYLATGENQTRFGNSQSMTCPVGSFHTADAPLYLACASDRTYYRFAIDVLERPDLASDPRYHASAERNKNRNELLAIITDALKRKPRAEWLAKMHAAGVPAGAVRTVAEAMTSEELAELGVVSEIPHPTAGTIPNVALPINFAGTPVVEPVAAPLLGQHSVEVLRSLPGYDEARVSQLLREGVIAEPSV